MQHRQCRGECRRLDVGRGVRMRIDESRRDNLSGGIDQRGGRRRGRDESHGDDAIAGDGDIGDPARRIAAVVDGAATDQHVIMLRPCGGGGGKQRGKR